MHNFLNLLADVHYNHAVPSAENSLQLNRFCFQFTKLNANLFQVVLKRLTCIFLLFERFWILIFFFIIFTVLTFGSGGCIVVFLVINFRFWRTGTVVITLEFILIFKGFFGLIGISLAQHKHQIVCPDFHLSWWVCNNIPYFFGYILLFFLTIMNALFILFSFVIFFFERI